MPEEVSQVSTVPLPVSTAEALGMLRAAMGFLNAADAAQMAAEEQARCLQALEQVNSMGTAARASILAAFTSGQGYCGDADYSPRAWLINRTQITKGAAVAYTAWARRAASHPLVAGAGRRGGIGIDRPDDLPVDGQAAAGLPGSSGRDPGHCGPGRRWTCGTWLELAGEIYARSLPDDPDKKRDESVRGPLRAAGDHVRRRGGAEW